MQNLATLMLHIADRPKKRTLSPERTNLKSLDKTQILLLLFKVRKDRIFCGKENFLKFGHSDFQETKVRPLTTRITWVCFSSDPLKLLTKEIPQIVPLIK